MGTETNLEARASPVAEGVFLLPPFYSCAWIAPWLLLERLPAALLGDRRTRPRRQSLLAGLCKWGDRKQV